MSGDPVESMCLTTAAASIPAFSVGMRLCFLRSRPDVVKEWGNSEVAHAVDASLDYALNSGIARIMNSSNSGTVKAMSPCAGL